MRCAGMRCAKRGMVQLCPCVHRWWNIRELRCAMRGGTQLRLQARRGSTRGGLAGRSRACKHCSGLALPRADGEHHRARGMGASSKAREGVLCQTPRRGLKAGRNRPLEEGCYWDKRERERERCVSAADASTYGRVLAHADPPHVCPQRKQAKTTPHVAIRLPLPTSPDKRLKPVPRPTQTRSIVLASTLGNHEH